MNGSSEHLYTTFRSKLWRELQMLPVKLVESAEPFRPTEFGTLANYVRSYTMASQSRLRGLYRAVRTVIDEGIPGDVVECGTAEGGSALLMAMTIKRHGGGRHLWAYDTFEGMPPPGDKDPTWANDFTGTLGHDVEHVREVFHRWDIREGFTLVKGLFEDTVPKASMEKIAVLHLDGDWYSSVKVCLDHLWDRVSPGGIIQIDDYGHWAGARRAVHDFLDSRGIRANLRFIDAHGRQLLKR
jgi:predicted O-methyltransferase YrrM